MTSVNPEHAAPPAPHPGSGRRRSGEPVPDASGFDDATHVETRGIELISDRERHGRARDLFAVWAAPNVSILNFTVGATLTLLGLEIWQSALIVLAGSLLWVLPGIIAISGPAAGTSGSVITRAIYGIVGNKLVVAFTGWLIGAVYLALTWLGAAFVGADLFVAAGVGDAIVTPVVVALLVAAVTVVVAVYGHGLILRVYPYVATLLLAIFLLVTVIIAPRFDWAYRAPEALEGVALWSAVTIGFTILASTPLSYINSPDFARYLPRTTKPSHIVASTALGGAIPAAFFTMVGVLLPTAVISMDAGIESALLSMLPPWLAPLLVVGVIVNAIALNGMTTYTSSMALQAIGVPLRRVPAAIVVGVVGAALTVYLVISSSLLEAVNLILQFLIIVAAPTMAVFVTDVLRRRGQYDGVELSDVSRAGRFWYTAGWGLPGVLAVVLGGIASALCLSTTVWTGPIAQAWGYIDLSVPAGGLVAVAVYLALQATPLGDRVGAERADVVR